MEDGIGVDVEDLATYMHDCYEKFAKEFGWKTQDSCKVKFKDLPLENQKVMNKMALAVICYFNGNKVDTNKVG